MYMVTIHKRKSEEGVSLLLAFLVFTVMLSIAVGISVITLREFQISAGASYSYRAIYAADAGAEQMLYIVYHVTSSPTSTSGTVNGATYSVTSTDSLTPFNGTVDTIRSTGNYRGVKRKVEIGI